MTPNTNEEPTLDNNSDDVHPAEPAGSTLYIKLSDQQRGVANIMRAKSKEHGSDTMRSASLDEALAIQDEAGECSFGLEVFARGRWRAEKSHNPALRKGGRKQPTQEENICSGRETTG